MSDWKELYQEIIVDHGKRPRNFRKLDDANHVARGHNPLCGDKINVYVKVEDDIVKDVSFDGAGCAISQASASMMTQTVKGKTLAEAEELFKHFHGMVMGHKPHPACLETLGKLKALSGVCDYPTRVKCATLAWHTLNAALRDQNLVVSTEIPGE